jgi:hypothetical protein
VSAAEDPRPAGRPKAKEQAKAAVAEAQVEWKHALRAHRMAPPDPRFADRLRALADSAGRLRDAYSLALQAGGLSWRPVPGSEQARTPYELRPGTGRRGPEALWSDFDHAVQRLNEAGAGQSLAEVVAAYGAVSDASGALADALAPNGE